MAFDQAGEIALEILCGERVRASVKKNGQPPYGAAVGVDGSVAFTLEFKGGQVGLVEFVKAFFSEVITGRVPVKP